MGTEFRDYENGVADVLAYLLTDQALVERNVKCRGHLSKQLRQLDIRLTGRLFGRPDSVVVVDCKRWGTKIDVKDVEGFVGLVRDVGADGGLLITTAGYSATAHTRAESEGDLHCLVMTLNELQVWSPRGTITLSFRLSAGRQSDAERALRHAGFRAVLTTGFEAEPDEVVINAMCHCGTTNPSGEIQSERLTGATVALQAAGIVAVNVANSITVQGGTSAHRWLRVVAAGVVTDLKVCVASRDDIATELDHVARMFAASGISRSLLAVECPDGWPPVSLFQFPTG